MPVAVCPSGHRIQIQDAHIGRQITCPSCHASFVAMAAPGAPGDGGFTDFGGGGAAGMPMRQRGPADMTKVMNQFVGKPLLFLGLILVLFGRGCDSISMRSVGRVNAQYQMSLHEAMKKAAESKDAKSNPLDDKSLKQQAEDAENARFNHTMASYWYVWLFVLGTILLMVGLLLLAFFAQGSERWVAYIMVAIVTFSIYVGGAAWIESVVSSVAGSTPPQNIKGPPFKGG